MEYRLILVVVCIAPLALGHLAGGEDVQQENYTIDFGHDPDPIVTSERTQLQFSLVENGSVVETDSAWIRVSRNDVQFTAALSPNAMGSYNMARTFDESGNYDLTIRFDKNETRLAEHTFSLSVRQSSNLDRYSWGFWLAIVEGVLVVILAVTVWSLRD